jgi:WD40 repeat protein
LIGEWGEERISYFEGQAMTAVLRGIRLSSCTVLLLACAKLSGAQTPKQMELPSPNEITLAVETMRDVYDKDYALAAKDSKARKALAQKLFEVASKRKTDAMVFACYEEARRVACMAGDVKLAVSTVTALTKAFRTQPRNLLIDTLKQVAVDEIVPADAPFLALLAREEADGALDREEYAVATDLMEVAALAAKKAEDLDLANEMRAYRARLSTLKKAVAVLKSNPDDAQANATLGNYWLFERKKWELGMRYLAKGSDQSLAEAAKLELGAPKTARERTLLADLWYKLHKETQTERKLLFVERAWEWYSAALAVATGDDDLKPSERVKEIEKTYPSLFDQSFIGHTEAVAAVAITPDGKTLVSVGNDNAARVWDIATGKLLRTLEGHTSWVGSVAVTPDGARVITAGGDRTIRVWDLKTGRQMEILEGHTLAIRGLALSADGRTLASASSDKTCRLWDLSTNKEIKKFGDGKESFESVAIAPDGSRVLAGNESGTIVVYDAKTGNVVSKFDKHGVSVVYAIAVTRDGKTAISGARDKEIQVWELATGQALKTLSGHTEQVYQVVLSPDEKQLLSVSYDRTIRIWDLTTGKELKRFDGHSDGVQGACYQPDGRSIFSASWDKTIRKWRVPPVLTSPIAPAGKKLID